jgi:hypothetical protein
MARTYEYRGILVGFGEAQIRLPELEEEKWEVWQVAWNDVVQSWVMLLRRRLKQRSDDD